MPDETLRPGVSGSAGLSPDSYPKISADGRMTLRLPDLTEEQVAELRKGWEASPGGGIIMHPPEPGPVEQLAIVQRLRADLDMAGKERAELLGLVAKMMRELAALDADLARVRRSHALALDGIEVLAASLAQAEEAVALAREAYQVPRSLDDWHEDIGPVLWWFFPVQEAPWCGGPNDSDWPGYHTHWTPLPGVMQPEGAPAQPTPVPPDLVAKARNPPPPEPASP